MITLEIGNLYGLRDEKELVQTINELKAIGMTDEEIQKVLDRSKDREAK